jgi:hypothetical protein
MVGRIASRPTVDFHAPGTLLLAAPSEQNARPIVPLLGVRNASRTRKNRRNRQISPVVQVVFCAPGLEFWRSTLDSANQTPRRLARVRSRKFWQTGMLHSSELVWEHGELAPRTVEKAPFAVIFRRFFGDILRVFRRTSSLGAQLGANPTPKMRFA